jgi:hypothetical protein
MCNLDDVTWGNRPANASKGMNVVVDNIKRQEILRQSYRTTRTHILIWWLIFNISLMFLIDSLILSALHNGNLEVKTMCQNAIKGYAYYVVVNAITILSLSLSHHVSGNLRQLVCSKYIPTRIPLRKAHSSDPENRVLLDDSEEEAAFTPPMEFKKKAFAKKEKSDIETDEDPSFFSDDLESKDFMQKYKKRGAWTY